MYCIWSSMPTKLIFMNKFVLERTDHVAREQTIESNGISTLSMYMYSLVEHNTYRDVFCCYCCCCSCCCWYCRYSAVREEFSTVENERKPIYVLCWVFFAFEQQKINGSPWAKWIQHIRIALSANKRTKRRESHKQYLCIFGNLKMYTYTHNWTVPNWNSLCGFEYTHASLYLTCVQASKIWRTLLPISSNWVSALRRQIYITSQFNSIQLWLIHECVYVCD